MHVCMYVCMYSTYVCTVCMYVCMYVQYACMYVRTYVRMYVCTYVCMYVADCQNAVSQIIRKMVVYYGARIKRFTCGMTSPHVCGNVVKLQNV